MLHQNIDREIYPNRNETFATKTNFNREDASSNSSRGTKSQKCMSHYFEGFSFPYFMIQTEKI